MTHSLLSSPISFLMFIFHSTQRPLSIEPDEDDNMNGDVAVEDEDADDGDDDSDEIPPVPPLPRINGGVSS